ncbi:unnamed protein product [Moneuplotes crassus]|uniref:Uncharacterized protein n=1 Tax=Euplotes crassus TaxID=5936 RepID=A0AAD1Y1C5_EUPCR|nr:unnamed protein product [Moneuplotes crassus]
MLPLAHLSIIDRYLGFQRNRYKLFRFNRPTKTNLNKNLRELRYFMLLWNRTKTKTVYRKKSILKSLKMMRRIVIIFFFNFSESGIAFSISSVKLIKYYYSCDI